MKPRIVLVACAGAASLVAGLALSVYPAQAAPLANPTSTTNAGWALASSLPASVSAADTFTVPKITCTPTSPASDVSTLAFIAVTVNAMTTASAGYIVMGCNTSASTPGVTYSGGTFINGMAGTAGLTPKAGDVMTATVSESSKATKATLTDVTQAKTVTGTGKGGTPLEVLDGMANIPGSTAGTFLPIPKFAPITFSAAKLDNKTPKAAGAVALNLVKGKTVQILTGPLNATGNGWTETFKHA
jgi:hypothetical protein